MAVFLHESFPYPHKDLQKADQESQSQYLTWLNSFKGKYKFTQEELLQIDVEVQSAKDKINTYNQKQSDKASKAKEDALKTDEQNFKSEYTLFKKSLDEKLKYKKITEDQYFSEMGKFAKSHQSFITPELGQEIDINNQGINDRRNDEAIKANEKLNKLKEDEQKKQEALLEKKKSAMLEVDRQIAENSQKTSELMLKVDNETTESFIKNEELKFTTLKDKLNKKIEELRLSGVEEIKIRQLINSEIETLQAESLNSFKEKEKEKKTIIDETKVEIQKVEKELLKLKSEKETLQNKGSFLTGEDSPLISMEQALKTTPDHFDSYQEKFQEEKKIDEEIKTVEEQKQSLQLKELDASKALATLKENEAVATGEVVTALNTFAKSLEDASSSSSGSSSGGGAGESSSGSNDADNKGFQNTYSGSMSDIEKSSGDSYNGIVAGGDSKNNTANKQIGDYVEAGTNSAIAGGAEGSGIHEQKERKKKSKKIQDHMNMGGGHGGNMPDSSSEYSGNTGSGHSGNMPDPNSTGQDFGWENPTNDKIMRDLGGKWSVKNLSSAINRSSSDIFKNFLQGASEKIRNINNSISTNNRYNSQSHTDNSSNQSVVIHFDNKQTQNITSQAGRKTVNDFISLGLAAKTLH